jgi:multiple sugar transport system ATP-binding protein
MNLLPGRVVRDDDKAGAGGGLVVDLGAQRLPIDEAVAAAHPGLAERVGQPVVLGLRPEALDDASLEPDVPGDQVLEATVDLVESLGAELMVHVAVTGVGDGPGSRDGAAVARLSTRCRFRPGDAVKLTVDPAGLHLFDPTTGASLRVEAS